MAIRLCEFRIPSGTLIPFSMWLGENRKLWRRWWRMGVADGGEAVGRHIVALWSARAAETSKSFDVDIHADGRGVDFVAEYPSRTVLMATHRFPSVDDTRAFVEFYEDADRDTLGLILAAACLLPRYRLADYGTRMTAAYRSDDDNAGHVLLTMH